MEPNAPVPSASASPQRSSKTILIVVLVLAILGATVSYSVLRAPSAPEQKEADEQSQQDEKQADESFQAIAQNVIVYGTWREEKSVIKSFNLETGSKRVLARLGTAVKKVSVLSPDTLLYIDKTDNRDHGKSLAIYAINNKKENTVYTADQGFGIDDYVLSPDKRYAAVWEVRFSQGSGVLAGGSSRVYSVDLSDPGKKNRLYDEVQVGDTPVHYPRAVLNSGQVFLDTFLPNSTAGWAYGMSVSNFQGTQKQDLSNMQNGTYGTQPTLSPDGRYLAFAGYDGTQGSGTAVVDGFRRALLRSNTVELLDTQTLQRQKLSNLPNTNTYSYVAWDNTSGKLIYNVLSRSSEQMGLYAYDLAAKAGTKLNLGNPPEGTPTNTLASYLSNGGLLVATLDTADTAEGNLGPAYAAPCTSFAVMSQSGEASGDISPQEIEMRDSMMQLISVLPSDYFPANTGNKAQAVGAAANKKSDNNKDNKGKNKEPKDFDTECDKSELQLCTFALKPSLSPNRQRQQSEPKPPPERPGLPVPPPVQSQPKCRDLAAKQCGGYDPNCVGNAYLQQKASNSCDDSPLYLYGEPGQEVKVAIGTHVFGDTPSYNGGYTVTLLEGDRLHVNGGIYDSLEYAYVPGIRKITAPSYGAVTTKEKLSGVLREYAAKLGLSEKETADLVSYGKETITMPYVFVSFFDQKTSELILPISFTPKPDNYLNVVFYFRQFAEEPYFTPIVPLFKPFTGRTGFTAVEVSAMVE